MKTPLSVLGGKEEEECRGSAGEEKLRWGFCIYFCSQLKCFNRKRKKKQWDFESLDFPPEPLKPVDKKSIWCTSQSFFSSFLGGNQTFPPFFSATFVQDNHEWPVFAPHTLFSGERTTVCRVVTWLLLLHKRGRGGVQKATGGWNPVLLAQRAFFSSFFFRQPSTLD